MQCSAGTVLGSSRRAPTDPPSSGIQPRASCVASFDHQDAVYDAAFSPDGTRILTASADHRARLWDAASGKLVASFDHQDEVFQAAFSPDGARVLTASLDKTAKLWDAATGKLLAAFVHQARVYHAVFSPDGARILTASADNTAKLWDAISGKLIASFDHQDTVRWAAFSPDGARILTASWDKTAKLWDAATPVALARKLKESAGDSARTRFSGSMPGSPGPEVESLSIIASGLKFSDDGSLVAVDDESRSQLDETIEGLSARLPAECALSPVDFQYRKRANDLSGERRQSYRVGGQRSSDESECNRTMAAKRFGFSSRSPIASYRAGGV